MTNVDFVIHDLSSLIWPFGISNSKTCSKFSDLSSTINKFLQGCIFLKVIFGNKVANYSPRNASSMTLQSSKFDFMIQVLVLDLDFEHLWKVENNTP